MNKFCRRVVPVLLACCLTGVALGQDKPPVVVGRVSLSSIDDFSKFITDIGVPTSPTLNLKDGVEGMPFVGQGSVDTSKPMGVSVLAGDPHKLFPIQDSIISSAPINAGKVTAVNVTAAGGTAVEGTTDTFKTGGGAGPTIRRTANYIHAAFGTDAFGLSSMNDAPFAADFKDVGNLFVITADFAAFRKAAPDAYQDLVKEITSLPRMVGIPTPDDSKPVQSVLDKMDVFSLALAQDATDFHLRSTLAPSPLASPAGGAKEAPRPAFPAGTIARMHIVYPTAEAAAYVEKQLAALPEDDFGMGMPPVYHQRAKDLVVKLASLNTRTDAVSLGVAMKEGQPVIYVVDQFSGEVDAIKEITDMVNEASGLAQEGAGVKVEVQGATYTAGMQKVTRLTLTPDAAGAPAGAPQEKMVIDEIQVGKTLYVALSTNVDGKYVVDLAAAGMEGKSTALCMGEVDLGALLAAVPSTPAGNPGPSWAVMAQTLKAGWAGQKVSWTVLTSAQNGMQTDVQVPKQVVRDLIKMSMPTAQPVQPATGLP